MRLNLLTCIVLCLMFQMSVAHSQNEIKKIDVSKITHPYFSRISIHYANTHLPFWLNKLKTYELVMEHEELRLPTMCLWDTKDIDPKLPLCPPSDKDISKCETSIWGLYFTTNGDYFIGMANAWSSNHRDSRTLLVTFAFDGSVIDYVPFYECYNCHPNDLNVVDGLISADLVVTTQSLHFENGIYPVTKDWQLKPNLKCQRIDRVYNITPEGKFNLKSETKFKPKVYTAEEIAGDKCILMGDEEVLE